MRVRSKPERIRDPLHNLIEFGTGQLERVLWRVIQTRPFQRLRRIRQLGFSELVYPGATHTRFAHCVGVFHTARQLMEIIKRHIYKSGRDFYDHQANVALAAALVHDVGHGMFSHAFEEIGKELKLKLADHEEVSDAIIRGGEINEAFSELGSGFANDVADVIKRGRPGNLYDAVVSSQFDADRLDYMQRDRLMTGTQNSGIDFTWLVANLEIGTIDTGVDEHPLGKIDTFVLGPKAHYAAETYVLALFQPYPTVYFHKTTRAAEKLFSALMLRVIALAREGDETKTGLPANHPFLRFAEDAESLANTLALDDTVFWGALSMFHDSEDPMIRDSATCFIDRRLPKCIDIQQQLIAGIVPKRPTTPEDQEAVKKHLKRLCASIEKRLREWSSKNSPGVPRILTDRAVRDPYKRFQESKGPLNQLLIRGADNRITDMVDCSPVVAAIEPFELFRAYVDDNDVDARTVIDDVVKQELKGNADGDG